MSYQEREIPQDSLKKHLGVLDSDEGIRIENNGEKIFVNRTSKRYCIDISSDGNDEFLYMNDQDEVLKFLGKKMGPTSRIFAY